MPPDEVSAAPVAVEAAPAPEATPAPTTTSSGANSSSDGPVSGATSPAPEATPSVVEGEITPSPYDSYNWNEWDGKYTSWPDEFQGWGERLHATLDNEREQIQSQQELYSNLLSGAGDSRADELSTQIETHLENIQSLEQKIASGEAALLAEQQRYKVYQDTVASVLEQEAERHYDRFIRQHSDVFTNADLNTKFDTLLAEDWEPEDAVGAVRLSDTAFKLVRAAVKEGTPVHRALELAEAKQALSEPRPRPGARLTSGARPGARPHQTNRIENRKPRTFAEMREFAIDKAFATQKRK